MRKEKKEKKGKKHTYIERGSPEGGTMEELVYQNQRLLLVL